MMLDTALHVVEAIHEYGGSSSYGIGVTVADIARGCKVTERTARRYVEQFAEGDFIARAESTDKRLRSWRLTVSGMALLRAARGCSVGVEVAP